MNIGLKIKNLRIENNLTQEDLAEQLGVSFQAISRWENSLTFPDITILPVIANMFNVTVDFLLDVDIVQKEKEIEKIIENDQLLLNQGKNKDRQLLLENAVKKYPNSWSLKGSLLNVYFTLAVCEDQNTYDDKSIKLANAILEKCTVDEERYNAMQVLILIYRSRNQLDKARQIVEKLPPMIISKDWFWPDIEKGEKRIEATQVLFEEFVEMFYNRLLTTYGRADIGKRDIPLLKYQEFLNIIYEKGDYGFYHLRLSSIYQLCANDQAKIQNKEKTIEYISLSIKHFELFIEMYNKKESLKHNSFLVDRLIDDPNKWSFSDDPYCEKESLINDLKSDTYNFIREDNTFKSLFNRLNTK